MGAIEIVIIVAAAVIVTGVAISAIVARKRGKGGCSGCAGCPHAAECSAKKKHTAKPAIGHSEPAAKP